MLAQGEAAVRHSPFAILCSLFAIRYSLFAIRRSPFVRYRFYRFVRSFPFVFVTPLPLRRGRPRAWRRKARARS